MTTATNTFQGLHAAHYDLIYGDKPYAEEARFVADLLGEGRGSLLDLACGTGRHAVEFARLGYEVTGVDYNDQLLERARRNAADAGVEIEFEQGDMRDLDLGRRFDAVTCLFDSIGYPVTDEGIVAALSVARRHLAPRGTLAVDFLHAPAVRERAESVRVGRWATADGGLLLRISETELVPDAAVMEVAFELIELETDGGWARGSEVQRNRYFEVEEMEDLMSSAGLEAERFLPAYGRGDRLDAGTWHVLALARPAGR